MSGVKKAPSSGAKAKPAPQANSMLSYFGRSTPAKTTTTTSDTSEKSATATNTTPSASTSSTASSSVPRSGIGDGASAVAAGFFGGVKLEGKNNNSIGAPPSLNGNTQKSNTPITPTRTTTMTTAAKTATPATPQFELSSSGRKRKTIQYNEDDDAADEEEEEEKKPRAPAKKSKRIDDEDEYNDGAGGGGNDSDDDDGGMSDVEDDDDDPASEEEMKSATKSRAKPKSSPASASSSAKKKPAPAKKSVAQSAAGSDDDIGDDDGRIGGGGGGGKEYSTDFLLPQNRKDAKGRRPGQPDYDPTTLYIPPSAMSKFTPAEMQYWDIKRANMDLVLFFKIGKFYEMFDEDANVGVQELNLNMMVNQARPHCGFPEAALTKYAERLVNLGYKVGQVDQTETPAMLQEANAKLPKGVKKRQAVNREISSVLTPGTLVDGDVLGSADANYLLSLTESLLPHEEVAAARGRLEQALASGVTTEAEKARLEDEANEVVEIGFTWVDCTTGRFTIGQHRDDQQRSLLKTILGFVSPREVILPRIGLSDATEFVLKHELRTDVIRNDATFPSAVDTITFLKVNEYFNDVTVKGESNPSAPRSTSVSTANWPVVLQQLIGEEPRQDYALSSYGAIAHYLKRTLHDYELISQRHVSRYHGRYNSDSARVLALDAQTLANLEVVRNQSGGVDGTLLQFVDYTKTPFGRRTMKDWIMKPLLEIDTIQARQDAIQFFMMNQDLSETLRKLLSKIPDLERQLSRVHANGLKRKVEAIMYDNINMKQLDVFIKTIEGFESVARLLREFEMIDRSRSGLEKGSRLRTLITLQAPGGGGGVVGGGKLPDFVPALERIRSSFDFHQAKNQKKIKPNVGLMPEYDECLETIESVRNELESYLGSLKRELRCPSIKWVHKNKEKYQIEIPIEYTKSLPSSFQMMSSNKSVKRYWTSTSKEISNRLSQLEVEQENFEKDMARMVFAKFAEDYAIWSGTVDVVAELDCLLSLAHSSQNHVGCVRPKFVDFVANGSHAMLNLRGASHPALYERIDGQNPMNQKMANFVPNDTVIGCEENQARFTLVSGANMGGKSTLLRQTCCAVILAQMGSWVPAEECQLTPIDRIFTRVGANDKLMQGQSTFLVELMETSHIINHATKRSLVILDELGRGTSTFDGTAIAYSVVRYLSRKIQCLTLFATHYHMLHDEFADDPLISMYHMSSRVNSDESDVTFLYKFIPGVCPKSYGSNVARAAGLSDRVIRRAQEMSEKFEARCVEAMGRNRARLTQAFPRQQTNIFSLPTTTTQYTDDGIDEEEAALLIQFKQNFELTNKQHAIEDAKKAKQENDMKE